MSDMDTHLNGVDKGKWLEDLIDASVDAISAGGDSKKVLYGFAAMLITRITCDFTEELFDNSSMEDLR